jgi:hypothetical protein
MCGAAKHKRVKLSVNVESRKVASTVFRKNAVHASRVTAAARFSPSPMSQSGQERSRHREDQVLAVIVGWPDFPQFEEVIQQWIAECSTRVLGLVDSVIGIALAIDAESMGDSLQWGAPAHDVGSGFPIPYCPEIRTRPRK